MDTKTEKQLLGYTIRKVMRITVDYSDGIAREVTGLYLAKEGCSSCAVWFMDGDNHSLPGYADVQTKEQIKKEIKWLT